MKQPSPKTTRSCSCLRHSNGADRVPQCSVSTHKARTGRQRQQRELFGRVFAILSHRYNQYPQAHSTPEGRKREDLGAYNTTSASSQMLRCRGPPLHDASYRLHVGLVGVGRIELPKSCSRSKRPTTGLHSDMVPGEGVEPSPHGFKDRHPAIRPPRIFVRTEGVEPSHQLRHQHLKLTCLPFHHVRMRNIYIWPVIRDPRGRLLFLGS